MPMSFKWCPKTCLPFPQFSSNRSRLLISGALWTFFESSDQFLEKDCRPAVCRFALNVLLGIQFRGASFGELKFGMPMHPFREPFRSAFIETKRTIGLGFDSRDHI